MKRFILPVRPDGDGLVRLVNADYHYLVRVRRMRPGGVFPALLENEPCFVEVLSVSDRVLAGKVTAEVPAEVPRIKNALGGLDKRVSGPPAADSTGAAGMELPSIILFQALPGGQKADLIVRQAAEGAVGEIVIFVSERSTVKDGAGREGRWRRIIREARQQSGSRIETGVRFLPSLDAALAYWAGITGARGILLHESPLEQGTFHEYLDNRSLCVVLAAGPEGGFSSVEAGRFLQAGFRAVCMGDTVLRTETAALYGAAAARIILLEKAAWVLKKNG